MGLFFRMIGAVFFLPFIFIFSFVLGPIIGVVLVVGGVSLLLCILGWRDGVKVLYSSMGDGGSKAVLD